MKMIAIVLLFLFSGCTVEKYPLISTYYIKLIKIDTTHRVFPSETVTGLLLTWQREDKTTYQEFAQMGVYVIGQTDRVKLQR